MLSTMQDGQLSIANLLRHGSKVHAKSEVVTWMGEGSRRSTYAEVGREAARLAKEAEEAEGGARAAREAADAMADRAAEARRAAEALT